MNKPQLTSIAAIALFIVTATVSAAMVPSQLKAAAVQIDLDLAKTNQVMVKPLDGGGYDITTLGDDPFIVSRPLTGAYDPKEQFVLSFDYFCVKGIDSFQLFFGPPFRESQSVKGPPILSSEGWTRYALNIQLEEKSAKSWRGGYKQFRLDFGGQAGRTIRLTNIRLRAPNAYEQKQAFEAGEREKALDAFEADIKAMVEAKYRNCIERVEASVKTVRITVKIAEPADDLVLCEVPLYQSCVGRSKFIWHKSISASPGRHTIKVNRLRGSHDRVFSSWILMQKTAAGLTPASHQRFTDTIPAKWSLTRERPISKKGTVGLQADNQVQVDDYKALGIHNATTNIVLPALAHRQPGENTFPHIFNGTTVHIDRGALSHLDKSMTKMEQLKIVVSAIILIPKNTPMSHPDCTPQGIYAMANVVERDGWTVYAGGLDFLAQRYMRPDRKFGRITHWIMHNEVDAGWVWTNAGEIPMHTYLDLYARSMRTAQGVIRQYGNAGNVLISLTHYWTRAHNERCYAPKAMLDLLARRSRQEGNFDWGLAYHPYPQNLRDPRTWLDKDATFDIQTKFITPKNLEVLDTYMRQKQMLYEGKLRTIVLSEQGSNSPDHSEQSYRDQAAGLAYTWLKFEKLDSIESYIHHRWMDHPNEGGLNLGFWTNRKGEAAGTRKPAWEIYRQLGTPEQSQAIDWLGTVIPESTLKNIPYQGNIEGIKNE